jgi:hypothetical protein
VDVVELLEVEVVDEVVVTAGAVVVVARLRYAAVGGATQPTEGGEIWPALNV